MYTFNDAERFGAERFARRKSQKLCFNLEKSISAALQSVIKKKCVFPKKKRKR